MKFVICYILHVWNFYFKKGSVLNRSTVSKFRNSQHVNWLLHLNPEKDWVFPHRSRDGKSNISYILTHTGRSLTIQSHSHSNISAVRSRICVRNVITVAQLQEDSIKQLLERGRDDKKDKSTKMVLGEIGRVRKWGKDQQNSERWVQKSRDTDPGNVQMGVIIGQWQIEKKGKEQLQTKHKLNMKKKATKREGERESECQVIPKLLCWQKKQWATFKVKITPRSSLSAGFSLQSQQTYQQPQLLEH